MNKLSPEFEIDFLKTNNFSRIIGIDEVGRGCWAGPVYVGAYIYDLETEFVDGVNDSKKLSLKKRNEIFLKLQNHNYQIRIATPEEIDTIGIGKTIERMIVELINELYTERTFFFVDGRFARDFGRNVSQEIKGDYKFYSIACASILAKVSRDKFMNEMSNKYVYYGFEKHKGYGTRGHISALNRLGICDMHRKSYKPIQKLLI